MTRSEDGAQVLVNVLKAVPKEAVAVVGHVHALVNGSAALSSRVVAEIAPWRVEAVAGLAARIVLAAAHEVACKYTTRQINDKKDYERQNIFEG